MKKDRKEDSRELASSGAIDAVIADVVKKASSNHEMTCNKAADIASSLGKAMSEVGFTLDLLEISITKCQLGLFGYHPEKMIVSPAQSIEPELERAIRNRLIKGYLPCAGAWDIAHGLALPKTNVTAACEALKIKIKPCQLGAF